MPRTTLIVAALVTLLGLGCGYPTLEGEDCTRPYPTADFEVIGDCEAIIGIEWRGDYCAPVSGCTCEGPGCDDLFDDVDACRQATRRCEHDDW